MGRKKGPLKRPLPQHYFNPRTKDPLTEDELKRIMKGAKELGVYMNVDCYRLSMTLLYTGMHPKVLYDIRTSRLRIVEDTVQWMRPKKRGSSAIVILPIYYKLRPWIDEFILSDFPQYRTGIYDIIHEVGLMAHIRLLSPMSFRHTFAVILDEMGLTPSEIQEAMNCSMATLMRYTSRTRRSRDNKMFDQGWVDGIKKNVDEMRNNMYDDFESRKDDGPDFNYHAKIGDWQVDREVFE